MRLSITRSYTFSAISSNFVLYIVHDWYQIILLSVRGTCVWTTCLGLLPVADWLGVEPVTSWSLVCHVTARLPSCMLLLYMCVGRIMMRMQIRRQLQQQWQWWSLQGMIQMNIAVMLLRQQTQRSIASSLTVRPWCLSTVWAPWPFSRYICLSVSLSAICLFVIHALWLNCTFAGKLFEHVNRIARQQPYGTKSDFLQLLICLKWGYWLHSKYSHCSVWPNCFS